MYSLRYILPAFAAVRLAAAGACSGTTTIQNSGDASALASCQTYTGNIVIATQAADEVRIDTLRGIDGDLTVVNANNIGSIAGDSLNTITGTFKLSGVRQLTNLDFPMLTEVGAILWKTLPALNGLSFGSGISKCDSVSITDTQLQDLSGLALSEAQSIVIQNNGILTNVSFELEKISADFTLSSNGQDMTLSLPKLTTAKNMIMQDLGSIDIPKLKKVGGVLDLESDSFQSVEAPSLETVGSTLTIKKNSQLSSFKFPQLTTISGGFVIASCPNLKTISGLPKLETIYGNLDFTGDFSNVNLPKLSSVKGAFNMESQANIEKICSEFRPQAGPNKPIRGNFNCKGGQKNPKGLGSSGSGTSTGGGSGHTSDPANLLSIPSGAAMGFTGVLAAIFGLL
jgi:hypothetical protein